MKGKDKIGEHRKEADQDWWEGVIEITPEASIPPNRQEQDADLDISIDSDVSLSGDSSSFHHKSTNI